MNSHDPICKIAPHPLTLQMFICLAAHLNPSGFSTLRLEARMPKYYHKSAILSIC